MTKQQFEQAEQLRKSMDNIHLTLQQISLLEEDIEKGNQKLLLATLDNALKLDISCSEKILNFLKIELQSHYESLEYHFNNL